MITNSSIILLAFVIAAVLATGAHAQEKTSLQFLAFPKMIKPEPVELLVGEGKTIEVQTPGHEFSPKYEVRPLETIAVGKTTTNEKGEPVFEVYGKAKSIGTSKQIILLLRKGKENSDGFVILPINGDLADFKGGSYFLINTSVFNVGGVIGGSKFTLNPGQKHLLKPKSDFEGNVCQVTLAYQREDDWKTFKDTRWSTNESYRSLVFFYQNPETGRLGVSPIVDMLPYQATNAN